MVVGSLFGSLATLTSDAHLPHLPGFLPSTAVEDITETKGGFFTVKFGGGLCVLVGQKVPTQFFNDCSFFPKKQKGKVEEDIKKLSDVKEVIRESIVDKVLRYIDEYAKGKGKGTAGKTKSAIKAGKSRRIMYRFADDLQFYTVSNFTDDDFRDEESTQEDRRAPDEDAQKDLRFQTCRFSISMSHARRSDGVEDTSCFAYERSHGLGKGLSLVSRLLGCVSLKVFPW